MNRSNVESTPRTAGFSLNITQQFIAYLVFLSVIPLLITAITSYRAFSDTLQQEISKYVGELIINQRDYLNLQLETLESLLRNISGVEEIRQAVGRTESTATTHDSLSTQAQIGYILNTYSQVKGLVSIDIYTVNGSRFHVGDTLNTQNIRESVQNRIFLESLAAGQNIAWMGIEDNVNANSAYGKVVTAAKMLYVIDRETLQQRPVATLSVNYSVDYLYDYFSQVELDRNAYIMVLDAKGGVIYHPNKALIGTMIDIRLGEKFSEERGTLTQTVNGSAFSINYARLDLGNWIVASFIPLETLAEKTSVIGNTTILILATSFALVALVAWVYNRNIVSPIRQITTAFKSAEAAQDQPHLKRRGNDEIGELIQWFNAFMDNLKERQRIEAERERLILELKTANEIAEENARLKSQFLSTMSHEFRTPLNAIEGFTSIILSGMGVSVDGQVHTMIERISMNSKRLLNLVNDFLDLSKIESGQIHLNELPFSPIKLANKWQEQMAALIEKKGLTLDVQVDPALPAQLSGDEEAISKVTLNLLSNAVKFTHEGKVMLRLHANGKNHWIIQVSDTGIGIPPQAQDYIFDEFRQVDQTSTRKYGGTGLGLSIAKKMVMKMGGEISVQSELNVGSTFTVILPLIKLAAQERYA